MRSQKYWAKMKNSGLVKDMWTPVDLKLPGWVTSAWPKPVEKLWKDLFSRDF